MINEKCRNRRNQLVVADSEPLKREPQDRQRRQKITKTKHLTRSIKHVRVPKRSQSPKEIAIHSPPPAIKIQIRKQSDYKYKNNQNTNTKTK